MLELFEWRGPVDDIKRELKYIDENKKMMDIFIRENYKVN